MNSFQINFEAARKQGFLDAGDNIADDTTDATTDAEWRQRMDAARQDMFGTTYARGYESGRRQAKHETTTGETVAEREWGYQKSMIDGLALRLEGDIRHAMTVVCRQDAEAKATKHAARVYGFERVFNCVLHPRARAHIDEFIKLKADEYEAEFRESHAWNTHHCEQVRNDLRLLESRVQNQRTASYVKKKIKEAKKNAESSVKDDRGRVIREAGVALQEITAFANQWKAKTRGGDIWSHDGHRQATGWENASNRAENLAMVRSLMFPELDEVDTTQKDAWAEALFKGRIDLNKQGNYPTALVGFSLGGLKIWLWWLVEQMVEVDKEEKRIEASFEVVRQRNLYVKEAAERKRKRTEERERLRAEEAERREQAALRLARERQKENERRRQVAEQAAKEKDEAAQRRAAERARVEEENFRLEQVALLEAKEAEEALTALREQHKVERAREENILRTVQEQAASVAGEEALRAARALEKEDSESNDLPMGSDWEMSESDVDGEQEVRSGDDEGEQEDGSGDDESGDDGEQVDEVEIQPPENIALSGEEFFANDKLMRMNTLKRYTENFENAKATENESDESEAREQLQRATEHLFDQTGTWDEDKYYEYPNGIPPAERLFLAVSLEDDFFSGAPNETRNKFIEDILDESDRRGGFEECTSQRIEVDEIFNNAYVATLAKRALRSADRLQGKLKEWRKLLRVPNRLVTTRSTRPAQASNIVAEVVQSLEQDEDESTDPGYASDPPVTPQRPPGRPRGPRTFEFPSSRTDITPDTILDGTAFGEVILGDKIVEYGNNQGDRITYKVELEGGEKILRVINESSSSSDATGSDATGSGLDSTGDGESSDTTNARANAVMGIPVASPMALVRSMPLKRHKRMHQAFARVMMKHASAIASRLMPTSVKRLVPKPATVPAFSAAPAVPVMLANHAKGEKPFRLEMGSLFSGDVPVVPEGMSR